MNPRMTCVVMLEGNQRLPSDVTLERNPRVTTDELAPVPIQSPGPRRLAAPRTPPVTARP